MKRQDPPHRLDRLIYLELDFGLLFEREVPVVSPLSKVKKSTTQTAHTHSESQIHNRFPVPRRPPSPKTSLPTRRPRARGPQRRPRPRECNSNNQRKHGAREGNQGIGYDVTRLRVAPIVSVGCCVISGRGLGRAAINGASHSASLATAVPAPHLSNPTPLLTKGLWLLEQIGSN